LAPHDPGSYQSFETLTASIDPSTWTTYNLGINQHLQGVTFGNDPQQQITVQVSADLVTWNDLGSLTIFLARRITDTKSADALQRFYRVALHYE
jgi:hypothetical protein